LFQWSEQLRAYAVSGDGRYVAFRSSATNLVEQAIIGSTLAALNVDSCDYTIRRRPCQRRSVQPETACYCGIAAKPSARNSIVWNPSARYILSS